MIRSFKFSYTSEDQLQGAIADALRSKGHAVEREVMIAPGCRIDMMVGRVGIEVKVGGAPRTVARQLGRYIRSDRVDGLVLVTSRVRHGTLTYLGVEKTVEVVSIAGHGL